MANEIPKALLEAFYQEARANVDENGQHVETLGYFLGVRREGGISVTELVIPEQCGNSAKVDDLGIFNSDTLLWAFSHSQTAKKYGEQTALYAWIHSHVGGCLAGLSSVDVHSQYAMEKTFGNVVAMVYEITRHSSLQKIGVYELTSDGRMAVERCTRSGQSGFVQHGTCASLAYFQESMSKPTITYQLSSRIR